MQQLNEIYQNQQEAIQQQEHRHEVDLLQYIIVTFYVGNSRFAVPVERVREVVELFPITAYPKKVANFTGVLNLRGNLVPVFDPSLVYEMGSLPEDVKEDLNVDRTVILETSEGHLFAIRARDVKKMMLSHQSAQFVTETVIDLDGDPVLYTDFSSLLTTIKGNAS